MLKGEEAMEFGMGKGLWTLEGWWRGGCMTVCSGMRGEVEVTEKRLQDVEDSVQKKLVRG